MIFAIDPGSEKTGTAVIREDGSLVCKQIVDTKKLIAYMADTYKTYPFSTVVMGNGTNHKHLQPLVEQWLTQAAENIPFHLVDEQFTTVEGRQLYWQCTPRHGWRRVVPLAFQYPPEPVDDFVAWIIGRRFLEQWREHTC